MAIVHDDEVLASEEITEAVTAAVHLVAGRELLDEIDEIGVATDGLPDGEVTFLLTDIEGSTPLLHQLGESRRIEWLDWALPDRVLPNWTLPDRVLLDWSLARE